MNYYDEILLQLQDLLAEKDYEKALRIIDNELELAYVPRDFEEKLLEYRQEIRKQMPSKRELSSEEIEAFLHGDEDHQLIAVDALHKLNLRQYLFLIRDYLKSDGFINAKVLLIDSLIEQGIEGFFEVNRDGKIITFEPQKMPRCYESEAYLDAQELLNEYYLKEPSKLLLAKQLLYKEVLSALPHVPLKEEGASMASRIEKYIDDAFAGVN